MKAEELIDQYLEAKMTPGARRAYGKLENGGKVCAACHIIVPRYPGRYPSTCPGCDGELEDLQNSPRYSESEYKVLTQREIQQMKDRRAMDAQMRRIPQDRVPS